MGEMISDFPVTNTKYLTTRSSQQHREVFHSQNNVIEILQCYLCRPHLEIPLDNHEPVSPILLYIGCIDFSEGWGLCCGAGGTEGGY